MQTAEEIISRSIQIIERVSTMVQVEAVCSWCHCEYDRATGQPIRKLTDEEYEKVVSHGMCIPCKHEAQRIG